jgi:hypothetical protein
MSNDVDSKGVSIEELPESPDENSRPMLKEVVFGGRGHHAHLSWSLRTAEGIYTHNLTTQSNKLIWRKVPCRTPAEGEERNALVLEECKKLLSPTEPMTLRHLFYLLVTAHLLKNCKPDYNILCDMTARAREDDEIDDDSITDDHRSVYENNVYDSPKEWAHLEETTYHKSLWAKQDSYIEFWFEKSAVMSVVERLHEQYQVTMRPFKGQASRKYCSEIAADFSRIRKPITVYYCGDHDPSGYAIPRSGQERVRDILTKDYASCNVDFDFVRLGFNPEHFAQHNIKSLDDIKTKDSSYPWFVEKFGSEDCAELDAIPPDELRTMITNAIESHISDREAWDATAESEVTDRDMIKATLSIL